MRFLRSLRSVAVGAAVYWSAMGLAAAQAPGGGAGGPDPQTLANEIQAEVEAIRGLPFKQPIKAENQSIDEFSAYLEEELEEAIPPPVAEHYDTIVRKLGLYSGSEPLEIQSLMKRVMASQAAAYYDPGRDTFFVLMQDLPDMAMGTFYAHELYHGLQDQHFDLDAYYMIPQRNGSLNDDELLARQAVVEGEATYMMTLWMVESVTGMIPPRAIMAQAVRQQSRMDVAALREAMSQPQVAALAGEEMAAAMAATEEIPLFILETMMGAYLDGLAFVFAVEEHGWAEVEKLYEEYPPASTEQILHPEKWFARESPLEIEWPAFETSALFDDWELLGEQNVLGEVQLRIVFAEHGLSDVSGDAAAGWDGDRYAVLRHEDSGDLLLLLHTSWDSEAEAAEFAAAYERLLAVKYEGVDEPTRVAQRGRDVLVVEGGGQSDLDAFIAFLGEARKTRPL